MPARAGGPGLRIGLAGNQPAASETILAQLGLPVSFIASSARWGVEKPSPEFFERAVEEAGTRPEEIAHVGDRIDNDVLPARRAGMFATRPLGLPARPPHRRRPGARPD